MARTHPAPSKNGAHHPATLDANRAAVRKKKPYKVVLEAVTQEKRKLRSIISYTSNAPTGFGFIPAGHPEFTEWCKEQCRQRNLDAYNVSTQPVRKDHADPGKISHHTHRIGYHFPLGIIQLACSKFNYTFDEERGLRRGNAVTWMERQVEDYTSRLALQTGRAPTTEKETKDHIQGAMREMFPKIPEADLSSIVNHAFQEGTNRVGNARELPLSRRVQLAVVAHIRHNYTDYDKLLKTTDWHDARERVEQPSLAKLKEWRDETGDQSHEVEDTFREVIVLDDDEDPSDDEVSSPADQREPSMEIVSSRATARELQPEQYPDHARVDMRSGRRAPRTIYLSPIRVPPTPTSSLGPSRTHPAPQPTYPSARLPAPVSLAESHPQVRTEPLHRAQINPMDPRMRPMPSQPMSRPAHPVQIRDAEGRLYNLEPIEEFRGSSRAAAPSGLSRVEYTAPPHAEYRHVIDRHVQIPQRVNLYDNSHQNRPTAAPISRRPSEQDVALPSVERDAENFGSPRRIADAHQLQSPKRKEFPMDNEEVLFHDPITKRMKPVSDRQEAYPRPGPSHSALSRQVYKHEPMEMRNRSGVQPPQEVIDLISSPRRPSHGGGRAIYVPAHTYPVARPSGYSYISAPPPPRDDGGVHYQPIGESPRAYPLEQTRGSERRPLPRNEYNPLREENRMKKRVDGQSGRY